MGQVRRVLFFLISFIILILNKTYGEDTLKIKNEIDPPLDINLYLSGTYGEIRSNHFHSGIDIKTQGKIGFPVHAIADGYVYRVKVLSSSYGKTLYIKHKNGLSSVYAHLDRFTPEIEEYVKKAQYTNREFVVNLFPSSGQFVFKKGEVIAHSGNSGYSFGPHLHFEIRDTKSEVPLNPLFYVHVEDTIAPKVYNVVLYPANKNSFINLKNEKQFFPVTFANNTYVLSDTSTLVVSGEFGIGVQSFDFLNNSHNKCGLNKLQMFINDTLYYKAEINNIPFSKTRYINSYIDYEEKVKNKTTIHKLFIEPNNLLPVYTYSNNNGIIKLTNDTTYTIKILLSDANNNVSEIKFEVYNNSKFLSQNKNLETNNFSKFLYYNSINEFVKNDLKIIFPENSFYDNIYFKYARIKSEKYKYSSIYHIHNRFTPIHNKFKILIKPDSIDQKYPSKLFMAILNEDEDDEEEFFSIGGNLNDDGFVEASSNEFGKYIIEIDTVSPTIEPLNFSVLDTNFLNKESIEFKIKDELTGIKSYNGFIDGNWVLFEYSKRDKSLIHYFDKTKMELNKTHKLEVIVEDEKNNYNIFKFNFYK